MANKFASFTAILKLTSAKAYFALAKALAKAITTGAETIANVSLLDFRTCESICESAFAFRAFSHFRTTSYKRCECECESKCERKRWE